MAWDKSQPQNTTKIRNLGNVITPNWDAIETADQTFKPQALNLDNRTALALPDPGVIADAIILFSKDVKGTDSVTSAQLYAIDENSNTIQLTAGPVAASNNGTSYLPGGVIIKWGSVTASVAGTAMTFVGLGLTAFPNNLWEVILTPQGSTGRAVSVDTKTAAGFKAYATDTVTCGFLAIGN